MFRTLSMREEVFLAMDVGLFARAGGILREASIPFRERQVYSGGSNRTGRLLGSVGESPHLENVYYIYVSKRDAERARQLLHELTLLR